MAEFDYDVAIIGSGFGGSVAALRLTEKGYRVLVIEAGRRLDDADLPKTSWRTKDFLWAPALGCYGVQRIHMLPDAIILAGAGVGGGSLVYANTLYVPPEPFFKDKQWAHITDWQSELAPYYDQAKRMLGVVQNPTMTPADIELKAVAEEMGVGDTFTLTPVGVYFGDGPGVDAPDPFFGGRGPQRTGCIECGECMTGCRHNAKNTLVKNYLYLAESAGAEIQPMTTVTGLEQFGEGFAIDVKRTGSRKKGRRRILAKQVVMAAGAYNTQRLLHAMKDTGRLPNLSSTLGELSRSNSESLLGAITKDRSRDYTQGVAITSSFYPEPHTHIEPVRYGKGSNMMGLLQTAMTDEIDGEPRWKTWVRELIKERSNFLQMVNLRGWSERSIILLVMQSVDNSLTVSGKRGRFGFRLTSKQGPGEPNPTWIPAGNEAARLLAKRIGGIPGGTIGDLVSAPMTAHFVGGAVIGDSSQTGVIDPYHRVYGHPGLHVVDGAAVSANLGVNPSLTITAQAERAMAMWPNKGESDLRPTQDQPYERISPVAPKEAIVPDSAPAALRLPIVEVR
ncbi:MAG: GMC family oxidoreductase [Candidatus Nanopelagicales bacterium]